MSCKNEEIGDAMPMASTRKRKEETDSNSDSDCKKPVGRRRRRIASSSPEREEVESKCKAKPGTTPAEELLVFCKSLSGTATAGDLKYIKRKAKECQKVISGLEQENESLKSRLQKSEDLGTQIMKLSETITGAVGKIAER